MLRRRVARASGIDPWSHCSRYTLRDLANDPDFSLTALTASLKDVEVVSSNVALTHSTNATIFDAPT